MPTVLAILPEGFEETEAVTPIDLLRRAQVEVTIASLGDNLLVKGRTNITVQADTTLKEIGDRTFDMVFLPGGPGVKHLRADARVRTLITQQASAGRWLVAICAAPSVLHDAGLLKGRRYTGHFSIAAEVPHLLADQRVVVDGKLITSRGAGTALDFGLVLVEHLVSAEKRQEVAASICA